MSHPRGRKLIKHEELMLNSADKEFFEYKGFSLVRYEWEKEIKKEEAMSLLGLCEKGIIDKIRYEIKAGEHIIEVDEFFGENDGLTIAEIELNTVDEKFEKPIFAISYTII